MYRVGLSHKKVTTTLLSDKFITIEVIYTTLQGVGQFDVSHVIILFTYLIISNNRTISMPCDGTKVIRNKILSYNLVKIINNKIYLIFA